MNFLCFGRPMTDIFFSHPDFDFLPFEWKANSVEHVDEEKMASILETLKDEAENFSLWDCASSGGNSLNTAFALTHYGHKAFFYGSAGDDAFGDFVDGKRRERGIFGRINRISGKKSGVFLVLQKNDEKMVFASPAAARDFVFSDFTRDFPEKWDCAMVEGTLLLRPEEFFNIDDFVFANKKFLAIDGTSPWFSKILGENFHRIKSQKIVFLNEWEWKSFTKNVGKSLKELTAEDETIFVKKMGENGAAVYQGSRTFTARGKKIPVANDVGAGDFFQGAFLHHYLTEGDIEAALNFSVEETAAFLEKRLHNG